MFGFSPLRCLPVFSRSLSHSPSLSALSGTLSSPPAKQYGTWPGQNHMLIHVQKWRCMRICASAAALRPFIFISFVRTPCHGCRSNPQTKYSLSFSVCGPSLAFFRDFGYHGRYSAHGYMCQTTPPLPSFPLFTFSISTTIRNMAAQFASQPRCTAHNPQPTVHIPHPAIHMPHSTPHMSQVWSSRESKQFIKLRRQQQQ